MSYRLLSRLKYRFSYTTIHLSYGKVNSGFPTGQYGKGEKYMKERKFVIYEYRTRTVRTKDRAKETDCAEAFGWEEAETEPSIGDNCVITFRRDRKIAHKAELTRLEKRADEARATLRALEKSKTRFANAFSWIFGVVAVLVAGGGMSLVMTTEGGVKAMIAGIILGVVGIAMCCVNYPIYNRIVLKKTREVSPAIDSGEEALANILEQGDELLRNEKL